jgi:hypothetical protein
MSVWNDFLDNIAKPVGRTLTEGAKFWANTVTGNISSPSQAISNVVLPAAVEIGTSKQLSALGLEENAQQAIKEQLKYSVKNQAASNDLVLKAGVKLHDEAISPYVTRPLSTLALMTDMDSPLYVRGEFEKGFQVSDFKRAYNRSEKVSLGQALTKSDLTPIKDVANVVFNMGQIDLDNIDLWDDNDVQAAFVDNTVGKYFTGGVDFIASNVAIGGVFGAVTKGGKFTARKTGLSSRGTTVTQLEKDINDGVAFETGIQGGKQTVSGDLIVKLANSTDANYVTTTLGRFSNNENLLGPILRAKNPETVRDLILADKGYLPALDRLSKNAPADLYEIGDVNTIIRNRVVETGRLPEFDETAWSRMNAAFDDAINRVPEYRQIKDALLDPKTGTPIKMGKGFFPIEPKFALGKKAAISVGTINQRIIGNSLNGPLTRIINFAGSQLPLGHVTFSGARPLDGVKELNAIFDSIDALRYTKTAGVFGKTRPNQIEVKPDVYTNVADFRNKVISDFVSAKDDISRVNVLNALDDQLGIIIGAKYGYYDVAKINEFTQTIKNHIFGATDSLSRRGYGMDAQSMRVLTDPQTQRQLVESYRVAPWNLIENEIKKSTLVKGPIGKRGQKLTVEATEVAQRVFEITNKYWSIDVLARPNYIPKNSLFEPSLSATMAHGSSIAIEGVPSMTKNFFKNNKNRLFGQISKKYNAREVSAINKTVEGLTDQLDKAVTNLNNLTAELDTFLGVGPIKPSPKAIRDNQARIVNELKAADKLVDDIELELRDAVRPFGKLTGQVPTIAGLERRVKYLESEIDTKGKFSGEIFAAKAAITKSKGAIATLAPDSKTILATNKEIALQYDKIETILKDLGEQKYNQALVYEKGSQYKDRFYGTDKNYLFVNNEYVPQDSLFNANQFGLAYKQEFGNARTAGATYLGELTTGIRQGMITRRGSSTTTYVNDPIYFEELAYFTNRSLRGDKLIDQILADVPEKELIAWGNKNIGYFEQFGPVSQADIPSIIADKVALVNRFLPDKEARLAALAGEVDSVQLQKILSKDLRNLSPIHPLDFDVHSASEFGVKNLGWVEKQLDKTASLIFSKLTAPENPIRWASGNKFFMQNMQRKVKELEEQGFSFAKKDGTVDFDKINVLRSAAAREALQMNESVFYTIRRQSKPLYAARLATAFPTASLNAFYRYGKFALNNPERVAQFLYNYQAAFRSFGVDKYGAPTDDPLLATHLVVPGTKEMGFFGGKGIRLNARSIGFLLNYPTPSIFGSVAVSKIYGGMPNAEDTLKNYLGSYYDVIFPFGPQPSIKQAFMPRWANDAVNYLMGPEGKSDFVDSWTDVHNYYMTLDELKIQKYPGLEEINRIARDQFGIKASWSFANVFGVPAKVDTNPMAIYDDLYAMLVNKYRQGIYNPTSGKVDTYTDKEAKKLAGTELNERLGVNFPLDRITFKGSNPEAYIQPNAESYNRVFKDNTDLAVKLAKVDPELIGLLSLDIDTKDNFNLTVYNILRNPKTKLPDGSPLNSYIITPEEQERRRMENRAWQGYYFLLEGLEAKAQDADGKSLRSHPELKTALKEVADNDLRKISESWWVKWNKGGGEDKAFKYAYGLNQIVSNKGFMENYGNTKLWTDVKDFTTIRNTFTTFYKSLPERDPRKARTIDAYNEVLEKFSETWHPKLKEMLTRNFSEDILKDAQ